uniref:Mediator of RNA polymerase II transcription subunit 27 n=1 Tax=Sus scrofa TaxID=9823 RepID=A0A8D0U9J4_PIG
MADVLSVGVNLEAFSQAISAIQALRSSVSRVFDCLKDGMRNKETLEGREKAFIAHFQDNLHSVNRDLNELERLSNLVGKPSENHPLHNSGLLSLDPVQDKTPLYSQLLQAYKWSNKGFFVLDLALGGGLPRWGFETFRSGICSPLKSLRMNCDAQVIKSFKKFPVRCAEPGPWV